MSEGPMQCPSCGQPNLCGHAEAGSCWCATARAARPNGGDGHSWLCKRCLESEAEEPSIFDDAGALTREFLLARGKCCGNKCRNCPYDWVAVAPESNGL
ncbi:MAG: cysteine-rich CWC family protein [Fimbriimonas sp.]